MEFLNFLREQPAMAGLVLLALLLTIVPVINMLWKKIFGGNTTNLPRPTKQTTQSTRFGNQTELIILLLGLVVVLVLISGLLTLFFR